MDLTGTPGTTNRFQHYELLRRADGSPWELGRGTMGVTYKAFDVNLRCEVALKVVNPALLHHPHARERFIREARAAAKLRHRNIASVYHLGNDGDRFFYAMEFIDGETLDALVRRQGPLSADATLGVLLQVARALAAAARQGVIHRDIKPGNLMVVHEDDDDHRVVKLIDFGLARAVTTDDDAGNLTANGFVGTPVYSSPEQMAEKPADERSDIYSLGVTAWFLLAGKPPFAGTVASIFQQHATKPPPWEALPKTVPAPVRQLLARMLEKKAARRPQTAVELRREIDACRAGSGSDAVAVAPVAAAVRPELPSVGPGRKPTPDPHSATPAPRELGPGVILKGRYELLRLVGEGNSGQVFEVRDRAAGDETRALKVFRSELTDEPSKREVVADEVRMIQAAPHANLIKLHSFDRLGQRAVDFLVEEWLRGFTLLDLLAGRGGALPVAEASAILAQAAAAVDHAVDTDLDRLDLALHQLHFHFAESRSVAGDDGKIRGYMAKGLESWPRWTLKVNPLGAIHDGHGSSTWAGEHTHLPRATPGLDRDMELGERPATSAASYQRGLARMVYEILGGAPGGPDGPHDKRGRGVSLPALSEEANAVLQRALSAQPEAYASCREFYEALAAATGNPLLPLRTAVLDRQPVADAAMDSRNRSGGNERDARSTTPARAVRTVDHKSPDASVADLLNYSVPAAELDAYASKSTVSDRLRLVSAGGQRYRSWLPTLVVAGILGLAFLAAGIALVVHRRPQTKVPVPRVAAAKSPKASAAPATSPTNLKPSPAAHTVSNDTTPRRESPAFSAVPAVSIPADVSNTPPPLSPTPAPRENAVKVRVDTRPSGAEIRMSGKLLGTTPLDLVLTPGDHQLVARYRNWPEVRHILHLDNDQLSALDEIHMIPPTLVPSAAGTPSPGGRNRPSASPTLRRDGSRVSPTPTGNGVVHFPSPAANATAPGRGPEPFLSQPTPGRRTRPGPEPFDPDGTVDSAPRRRAMEPPPLLSEDGAD